MGFGLFIILKIFLFRYGTDSYTVAISDEGYTGDGGALWTNSSHTITINPVNDPPELTFPYEITCYEDEFCPIGETEIVEHDPLTQNLSVTLEVTDGVGTLFLSSEFGGSKNKP